MKNKFKLFLCAVSCLLTAAIVFNITARNVIYAVEGDLYIGSIQIFTASSKNEAKKQCEAAGYLCSEYDLNTGN